MAINIGKTLRHTWTNPQRRNFPDGSRCPGYPGRYRSKTKFQQIASSSRRSTSGRARSRGPANSRVNELISANSRVAAKVAPETGASTKLHGGPKFWEIIIASLNESVHCERATFESYVSGNICTTGILCDEFPRVARPRVLFLRVRNICRSLRLSKHCLARAGNFGGKRKKREERRFARSGVGIDRSGSVRQRGGS